MSDDGFQSGTPLGIHGASLRTFLLPEQAAANTPGVPITNLRALPLGQLQHKSYSPRRHS